MDIYVVYCFSETHTTYVVKRFTVSSEGVHDCKQNNFFNSYSEAQRFIPDGMSRVPRSYEDEPEVVESWL